MAGWSAYLRFLGPEPELGPRVLLRRRCDALRTSGLCMTSHFPILVHMKACRYCCSDVAAVPCSDCTSGFMDDVTYCYSWPYARSNALVASYWLHHVLDDGGHRNWVEVEVEPAIHCPVPRVADSSPARPLSARRGFMVLCRRGRLAAVQPT